ncbi:adenine phosphoribosyltransferase [Ornithinimicrobium sp. F0845]|uniref:adenine phosphoribosyltransferase n=1 Tax=Ornithinimicrobium sp. F0845 TaxID=2926412 RepID=UPI001FF53378|nr:adenine phosphoribosyltransferase [Ornithinimicrobium sp. F0845]MCK0111945.1 adenine phosphoribosyltransferase [Ornithinimicrobium sp. F0845]
MTDDMPRAQEPPDVRDPALAGDVAASLRDVPDFPEAGVLFKDFTPLLLDVPLRDRVVRDVVDRHAGAVEAVLGIEARGFILGAAIAQELGVGFIPVRKQGKLPAATHAVSYSLEYGTATVEIHTDAVRPGQRVLVVDDVLATGGTAAAAVELVRRCGGEVVAVEVVLELGFLAGRTRLDGTKVHALLTT